MYFNVFFLYSLSFINYVIVNAPFKIFTFRFFLQLSNKFYQKNVIL